ncbi:hypothetical protein [Proteiniphilum sp. UBA5384]|uniref:hypothetical protein n=1 Tax=Proteiniphilum sp. UBA5384 TaxID=1947279 RepID=UPI0025D9427D|nr:hypothetical protein [Proteiniphilum sp. UBA5384]
MKTRKLYLLLSVYLLFSCQNNRGQKAEDGKGKLPSGKLERLMLLFRDSVMAYYGPCRLSAQRYRFFGIVVRRK